MKSQNPDMRNFISGGLGYSLGAVAGVLFIFLVAKIGLAEWLFRLIDNSQALLQLLGIPLIAAFLLALSGAIMGGLGGRSLKKIMHLPHQSQTIVGSAIAFAISTGLLTLVFLFFIGFIALYNNLSTNRVEQFGIIFGLFGLIFGLVTGILQALMSVKLRHSWRVILANILGFTLGGIILGILVRWVNPTEGFQLYPILTWLILLIGLLTPFFLSGGALGFTHGRLAARAAREDNPADYILPTKWQTGIIAVLGLILTFWLTSTFDSIGSFLTINPANLQPQLTPVTIGVQWTDAEPYRGELAPPSDVDQIIITGMDGTEHRAWCSPDGIIHYQEGNAAEEQISFPGCLGTPGLAANPDGQIHLVWYTQEIRDTNGVTRPSSVLVESIRTPNGWSDPAIAAHTDGPVTPALSVDPQGNLLLVWADGAQNLFYAIQENYQCAEDDLSYIELAGLEAVYVANLRAAGTQTPYCRNQFEHIQYTPNPRSEFSDEPITPDGAFDQIAVMVDSATYEVLFTTMQYEPNNSPPSPGSVLAQAVASLYQRVKANPEDFPRGMTVRIMLGNYPEMSDFAWGTQIIDAIGDIRAAGVEKMVDPEIGWRLEIANFPGTYPHSHTKFIVIDGKTVASVGYNYGYLHLPVDHLSGKGYDMFDLGMQITGPVAQDAISAYDDMWEGADQIHCEDFHPTDGTDWQDTCDEIKAVNDHVPEVLRTYLTPEADGNAFSLYRSSAHLEGDTFIAASLAAAQESIDILHVNFALEVYCMANLLFPDLCTIDQALPWMHAIIEAIETNPVKVRVIVENTNSNGLENRVGVNVLMTELERLGYSDRVDVRFYDGKLHAKSTLIDDSLLIIGSQNMHYSAWGVGGLTEHSLTTNAPVAIDEYKTMFETKWEAAIPFEEAEYGSSP